ncbi:MAG: penicillin-binding protein [Ginsengibacter sp.]
MDVKKDILWRVYLCFIGIILLGFIIIGRTFYIQLAQGDYWKNMSDSLHLKYVDINAERGSIYSEDGNMLSTSIPLFDIYIDFGADGLRENNGRRFYDNLDSLSISLARLFNDGSAASYKKQLRLGYANRERYYPLKKKISFDQYKQLRDFALINQGRNKSGFIIDVRDNRVNPYVLLANRTIGLSRGDTSKNVGLERAYDSLLKGRKGKRLMRYMAGAYVPVDGAEIDPENGKDIITTIDTYMQDVAENALLKMMAENNSLHGTCIVMETITGKIKAIANLGKRPDGSYLEDYNYGIGKRTEPGSIFKLATLLSLLEDKYVDTGTIVDCEGGQKLFYGLRVRDSHLGIGSITIKEAFARSSNVAFAKLAEQFYHSQPSKFIDHLHTLRLDTITGVDIVGQAVPLIKKPNGKFWTKTTLPFMAHGYEELITPLHMLMVYNAVANNGKMMKPYLVNSIRERNIEVKSFSPTVLVEKICSDETLGKLKDCLLEVVESEHGTAHRLKNDMYSFAGKTGTAVTALDNRGYNKANKIYQSSFIGYFPADKPKYSIAVVIQNGYESRLAYGGVVSAPVFKEVADRIYATSISDKPFFYSPFVNDSTNYKYYGLNSDLNKILNVFNIPFIDSSTTGYWRDMNLYNNQAVLLSNPLAVQQVNTMPDVRGLGLKDAVYLLENIGLNVSAAGRGKVMYQSVAAGTNLSKGETINIQLN